VPVAGGTGPGSTWDALFGWEALGTDGELTIPAGPQNRVASGTLVSGPLPTVFTKPAPRRRQPAPSCLASAVVTRTGRTQLVAQREIPVFTTAGSPGFC
jgi:hypothetical protein